jgi:hypothetical protein
VAAAASNRAPARAAAVLALALTIAGRGGSARADDAVAPPAPEPPVFRVESVTTRMTSFSQYGHGYQSQAGPATLGPGSERATILEPQLEIVASQGERLTHRFWVPVDIVTAASPDSIDTGPSSADVVSAASRHNIAGAIDWAATYKADRDTSLTTMSGVHLEMPFRSWNTGFAVSRAFADGATVLSATALEVYDWFDRFDIGGHRHGRTDRSSSTLSAGVTQILTPTTVVNVNYGVTLQQGEMGNTWNSVPLESGDRGAELLPDERVRHALVGRVSQALPWNGALRGYYRFYADDWGNVGHTAEAQLLQRFSRAFYVGALYRFHTQTGVSFFTPFAPLAFPLRTADSDLARLDSHTLGGKLVLDLPLKGQQMKSLHIELGYERYFRTNDLSMDVLTCALGYRYY